MAVYVNNREQWPDGLWEEWGAPPPDEKRCQFGVGSRDERCGLPAYADSGSGEPRCLFHYEGEDRNPAELRSALETVVAKGASLSLRGANLQGANLSDAKLQGANLERASLEKAYLEDASLQKAHLWYANLQQADLGGAHIQAAALMGANFQGADLQDANLQRANLGGADLQRAILERARLQNAWLGGAKLQLARLQDANLHGARLRNSRLDGANLSRAILRGADLRHAAIVSVLVTDPETELTTTELPRLAEADLSGALLSGATIGPAVDLGTTILDKDRIRDEFCARDAKEWEKTRNSQDTDDGGQPTLLGCEAAYRQLKLNYQESGDYQTAGQFFIREMECHRAQLDREAIRVERRVLYWAWRLSSPIWASLLLLPGMLGWNWAFRHLRCVGYWLMYYLCGYGEQPGRIFGWIVAVLALFAVVQGGLGIIIAPGTPTESYAVLPGWGLPSWEEVKTCLYFSVVTFTTLGYGDLAPEPQVGRILASAEAALGFVLMSLFLVCIVRKYSR